MGAGSTRAIHRRLIEVLSDLREYVPECRQLIMNRRLVDGAAMLVVSRL